MQNNFRVACRLLSPNTVNTTNSFINSIHSTFSYSLIANQDKTGNEPQLKCLILCWSVVPVYSLARQEVGSSYKSKHSKSGWKTTPNQEEATIEVIGLSGDGLIISYFKTSKIKNYPVIKKIGLCQSNKTVTNMKYFRKRSHSTD